MRKEYDLTQLKVKRRAPLNGLHGVPEAPGVEIGQVQVTMMLDKDVTMFYEKKAMSPDGISFTEVINRILREHMRAH
jgi:hypothetical protein